MKKNWKRHLFAACLCGCMLLPIAPPASAAEFAADITPDMTMKQLRRNPGITAAGISTYDHMDGGNDYLRRKYENETLEEYVGSEKGADCARSLNMAIENYDRGVQVIWQLYSPEEIAQNPALGMVQLYYYPAQQPDAEYVLVVGGNAGIDSGHLGEALASAYQLHEQGFAVFSLRYRSCIDATDDAPLEDAMRALKFIDDNAEHFGVRRENYALLGYSSGGHILGLLASESPKYGYRQLGVPAPAALLLAYPVNDFLEFKPVYSAYMDPYSLEDHYYWHTVSGEITANYPPTYLWCGRNDNILKMLDWRRQVPAIEKALQCKGVTHTAIYYDNAEHAVGVGQGTDAEGWITDAVAFWRDQCR